MPVWQGVIAVRVFISYASDDERTAQEVTYAVRQLAHDVFLGSGGLEPAQEYHETLRQRVKSSDLFVFLISKHSVAPGRYTLTELRFAKEARPSPTGFVLPVLLDHDALKDADPYLTAVTVLEPVGNVAAEVADCVSGMVVMPACDVLIDASHGQDRWRGLTPVLGKGYSALPGLLSSQLGLEVAAAPARAVFSASSLGASRMLVLPIGPEGRTRLDEREIAAAHRVRR